MPMESIAQPTIQNIRDRNRAEQIQIDLLANVIERFDVYAALANEHPERHANFKKQHAERMVDAVLALSGARELVHAAKVIARTPMIRAFLIETDPKALEQLERATRKTETR